MLRTLTLEDHPNIATLENHLKIAVEAGAYARSIITKSWTSLEADITRRETDEQLVTLRQGTQNLRDHYFTLDPLCLDHPLVESHEKVIALTTKFSLGNCAEMVAQALDYIAKNNINVNAETFHINNSDHAILVIGRKPRKRDPELFTRDVFGPETVICDPWANKYYPAKDYLQHLEGYKTNFDAWNKATKRGKVTHSLHPNRHQLVKSWSQPSANEIQQYRQLSVLKVNYRVKAENILATIEKYLEALIKTKNIYLIATVLMIPS